MDFQQYCRLRQQVASGAASDCSYPPASSCTIMKQASEPIHSVHHMTLIRTMLWVVTTFSCGVAVAQSNVPPTLALGNQITSLATLLSDGYSEEFTEARTYHSVDLF